MQAERIQALVRVLDAEIDTYTRLRDVLQSERTAVLDQNLEALTQSLSEKEALAAEARLLEENLAEQVTATAAELGMEAARPRVSEIAHFLGRAGAPLTDKQLRLAALVGTVRELIDANSQSTRQSLAQVRATIQLLGRLWPDPPTYQPDASPDPSERRGGLVTRSA